MTISSIPLKAADSAEGLSRKVQVFIDATYEKAADGLTLSEFCEISVAAMRISVASVDHLLLENADKKLVVLTVVGDIFDRFSDAVIPMPLKPVWWIVKPAFRSLCLSLAAGAVEALLPLVRIEEGAS